MELVAVLLDEDEKILWMKEKRVVNLLSKKEKRLYKLIKQYYPDDSDEILMHYSWKDYITNKHLITLGPNRERFPDNWYGVDVSHIFKHRREFRFFNLDKLTEICTDVIEKKQRYNLGLYFEPEGLYGDDAPNHWLEKLAVSEFEELLSLLKKVAPQAKIKNLFD